MPTVDLLSWCQGLSELLCYTGVLQKRNSRSRAAAGKAVQQGEDGLLGAVHKVAGTSGRNKKAKRAAAADLEAAATAQVPARNATKSGRKPKPSAKAAEQLESDELLEDEQSAESGSSSEEDDKGMTTSDDDSI